MENTLFYLMLIAVVVIMVGMALFLWNSRRHTSMCMKSAFFAVIILTIAMICLLYFNNSNQAFYDPQHDVTGADNDQESIPQEVLAAAEAQVSNTYNRFIEANYEGIDEGNYDDWRITHLSHIGTYTEWGPIIEVYYIAVEYHAKNPDIVDMQSGMYICDDNWVGGFDLDDCPYLVFLQTSRGLNQLKCYISDGYYVSPDELVFHIGLCRTLLLNRLKLPSDYTGHDIYLMFHSNYEEFLEDLSKFSIDEQDGTWNKLTDYIHNHASEEDASLFNQDISNLNENLALGNLSDTAQETYMHLQEVE